MATVLGLPVTSLSGLQVFHSFIGGGWVERGGIQRVILSPSTGEQLGAIETGPVDWNTAVTYARTVGVQNLRKLSLTERATMLAAIVRVISDNRDKLIEESKKFGGKTHQDAKADIDGAALVYQYYAELGKLLATGQALSGAKSSQIQGNF